jgi:YggT family protein
VPTADVTVSIVAAVVLIGLMLFFVLMWVRFILDWMRVLRPGWRPRGAVLLLAEGGYTLTDPPIRFVRRRVRPVELGGGIRIELSWSIVMLVCLVLMWIVGAFV